MGQLNLEYIQDTVWRLSFYITNIPMRKAYPKSMTVAELIKELQKFPPDLEVAYSNYEGDSYDFYKINRINLQQVVERMCWYDTPRRESKNIKQIVVID